MGNQDEVLFRPLSMEQCWYRSYTLLKQNFQLYMKIATCLIIPISCVILIIPPIDYTFDDAHFPLLDVALLTISIQCLNGPIMIATAEIYMKGGQRRSPLPRNEWFQCITFFFTNQSPVRRQQILVRTVAAGLIAIIGVFLGSLLMYLPGIYLAIGWYFIPCIMLFENGVTNPATSATTSESSNIITSIATSFQRSWNLTSRTKNKTRTGQVQVQQQRTASSWSIFWTLLVCFLLEVVPMIIIVLLAAIFHESTSHHAIFGGHKVLANFVGFTIYAIPNIIHKCIFIPFTIILKFVIYMNIQIINGLTGPSFRSQMEDNGLLLWDEAHNTDGDERQSDDDMKPFLSEDNKNDSNPGENENGTQVTGRHVSTMASMV